MKNNVISIGLGIVIGLVAGIGLTWYMTKDLTTQAVIDAEVRFNELLKTEKSKYQGKLDRITFVKDNLEHTLTSTEVVIDSLNTTIDNRSKELNRIKKKICATII